jgi:hypothetical protein
MSYSIKLSFLYPIVEPLGHLRFSAYFPQGHYRLGERVQTIARVAFLTIATTFCLSINFKFIPIKPIYLSPPLLVVAGAWIMTRWLTPPMLIPSKKDNSSRMSSIPSNDPVIRKLDFNTLSEE